MPSIVGLGLFTPHAAHTHIHTNDLMMRNISPKWKHLSWKEINGIFAVHKLILAVMKRKWCNNGIDLKETMILLIKIKCVVSEWMLIVACACSTVRRFQFAKCVRLWLVAINLWHSHSCFADIKRATSVALTKIVAWLLFFLLQTFRSDEFKFAQLQIKYLRWVLRYVSC